MAAMVGTVSPLHNTSGVLPAQKPFGSPHTVHVLNRHPRFQPAFAYPSSPHINTKRFFTMVLSSRHQRLHSLSSSYRGKWGHKETQYTVKKIDLLVGRRVAFGSDSRISRRHVLLVPSASRHDQRRDSGTAEDSLRILIKDECGERSQEIAGEEDSITEEPTIAGSHIEEHGVHLGRRMLLGTVFAAAALSTLNTPGLAWSEEKSGGASAVVAGGEKEGEKDKGGNPAQGSAADTVKIEKGGSQVGEKWTGSRVYDATVLGEPVPLGGEKGRVWQKLMQVRVVYLGESEIVPEPDDKVLELGIVRTLRDMCFEQKRPVSVALDAFPALLQKQLDDYMSKRLSDAELKASVDFWPDGRWQEYLPLLQYCQAGGVRLMACGTPPEVIRTIQVEGIQGLNDADRKKYVSPLGGGFGAGSTSLMDRLALADVWPKSLIPNGPGPYQYSQARIVADHVTTQVVEKGMSDGGSAGLLVVITGASHILYGSRGTGLPARVQKKLQKRTQAVVLLNPERQRIRKEGDVPEADFLWYSAAKACSRNCFDRAEVARVMGAAGRRRDALPQDIQAGLERGLVDPEVLKSFFELDQQPIIAELTRRYQGLRERWLADPRFFQRLAIEETISITTTLLAQYERRGDRFWSEIEYVITDSVRGAVVDFFTVWLPAPTLSFRSLDAQGPGAGAFEGLRGLLGSVPDNAFQRARVGESFDLGTRGLAVLFGGMKLFGVGFISSIGTLSVSNAIWAIRKVVNPELTQKPTTKRSPIFKTAFVYGSFLGLSANLRYQAIAGLIEHWVADYFLASQPLAGSALSFVARVGNSYWGTQQWVDLARLTGLQAAEADGPPPPSPVVEGQKKDSEDSLEVDKSTWEPPSLPKGSEADTKQEVEPKGSQRH